MSEPRWSVVTGASRADAAALAASHASLIDQTLTDWEWCVTIERDAARDWADAVDALGVVDTRIRVGSIDRGAASATLGDALTRARGEFVLFLGAGDTLVPEALSAFNHALVAHAPADLAYADEVRRGPDGTPTSVVHKPVWSPERLRGDAYVGSTFALPRERIAAVGGLRPALGPAAALHDLVLRVTERRGQALHLPAVLSAADERGDEQIRSAEGQEELRRVVQEHCDRVGIDAEVLVRPGGGGLRVRRRLADPPEVSVVLVGDAGDEDGSPSTDAGPSGAAAYEPPPEVVVSAPFSAALNEAVAATRGQVVALLDASVVPEAPDWLATMVAYLQEADCALVGGTVVGPDEPAERGAAGLVARERSAVDLTAAVVRREVWDEVGGVCEQLDGDLAAVDLAAKIRFRGYRVVETPDAVFRSVAPPPPALASDHAALDLVVRRWATELDSDPYDDLGVLPLPPRRP